jgi:glycosyltransferase involved in cell wall biosynthesis
MRVAYVTLTDPRDPESFNGSGYWIGRSMQQQGLELDYVVPVGRHNRYGVAVKSRLYKRVLRQWYTHDRDMRRIRGYGREVAETLKVRPADVVLSPYSPGSQPVAYLESAQPIVIWSDATLAQVIHEGGTEAKLCRESRRHGLRNEASALSRASLLLYLSDWAAQGAIEHHRVSPDKVHVLPTGPNLEIRHGLADVQAMIDARSDQECRLLFCGRSWQTKGADIAVETAAALNRLGIPTRLDIVGSRPPDGRSLPAFVRLHGFLRKSVPAELDALLQLYRDAHFFLLPTRWEPFGHVFTEAAAFGLPSIATQVGGVPSAVSDGVSGRLLPLAAEAEDYAALIFDLFDDAARYRKLAATSFAEYESRFAWPVVIAELERLLLDITEPERPRPVQASADKASPLEGPVPN